MFWVVFVALLSSAYPESVRADPTSSLKKKFERVLAKSERWASLRGISVVKVGSGTVLFEDNADEKLNLASNGKLISTAAVMQKYGSKHRFETLVYGAMNDQGVVEGDLFIVGGGDPKLMEGDLRNMTRSLTNMGLKSVTGGVVVDDFLFDQAFLPPAYEQKNTDAAYRSSAGALGINYNAVAVSFRPGKKVGTGPVIRVSPESGYPLVDNKANTRKGKSEALTITTRGANTRTRVIVDGSIGHRAKGGAVRRRIDDPGVFTAYVFQAKLRAAGVRIGETSVRRGKRPEDIKELLSYASAPLEQLARDTNEFSNNMMAETLFKTLGVGDTQAPVTWDNAQEAAFDMLEKAGVKRGTYQLLNGSGLYEADLMTANQMNRFLVWAREQENWGEKWVSTLPVGGKTGTLRGRLKKKEVIGKVRAKTGTLDNVVTLSGYVTTRTQGVVAFSFLFNGIKKGKANLRAIRRIQDELCGILAVL